MTTRRLCWWFVACMFLILGGCQCGGETAVKQYECDNDSDCKKNQACKAGKCILDDNDGDGFPSRSDCDDNDKQVYPGRNEICDNKKDDNCNNQIDEIPCRCLDGQTKECGTDIGSCKKGTQQCVSGRWGDCKGGLEPERESCNGVDDDCDGQIDEDFPLLGKQCERGEGECKASGKYICSQDRKSVDCDGTEGKPEDETCDGKDNDCDGKIDEVKECQKRFVTGTNFSTVGQYNKDGKVRFFGVMGQMSALQESKSASTSGGKTLRGGILSHTMILSK